MTEYLIKLTPLEPYTFGQEMGFQYGSEKGTGKQSYIMESGEIPDQTSLFGVTRYLILKGEKLLKADYGYSSEEKDKIKEAIGETSFSFDQTAQSFGKLTGISPMFLMNEKNEILVANPFHNQIGRSKEKFPDENGFRPIQMTNRIFSTSHGQIHLPRKKEYDVKQGYGDGFYNLSTGQVFARVSKEKKKEEDRVRPAIFTHHFYTGIRKSVSGSEMNDAFFKIDRVTIEPGYCFAYFAKVDSELPDRAYVYLGKKRNAFLAECTLGNNAPCDAKSEQDVIEKIQKAFSSESGKWYYAWSDLNVSDITTNDGKISSDFCIKDEKTLRNLQSSVKNGPSKIIRNRVRVNLIRRGSVFYQIPPEINENSKAYIIGLNRVIEL